MTPPPQSVCAYERKTCTKDAPMPAGDRRHWCHPDAVDIGTDYGFAAGDNDYDIFRCPNCGLQFKVTVPQ